VQISPIEISDESLAAVLSQGLRYQHVSMQDVIRRADREIERRPTPPSWIVELSMSARTHVLDVVNLLNRIAGDVDRVTVARGLLSLVVDTDKLTFSELGTLAAKVYQLTYDTLEGDWAQPMLNDADRVADNFDWLREGYTDLSEGEVMQAFDDFLRKYSDRAFADRLYPVRFVVGRGGAEF
jgi:hypothetical protein